MVDPLSIRGGARGSGGFTQTRRTTTTPGSNVAGVAARSSGSGGGGADGGGGDLLHRVIKLESEVGHLSDRLDDLKSGLATLDGKFDRLKDKMHSNFVWLLLAGGAAATALVGVMARGFGWLK